MSSKQRKALTALVSLIKKANSQLKGGYISDDEEVGMGIIDNIKGFFTGARQDAPPAIRQFFFDNATANVRAIMVGRVPVVSAVQKILNIASLGQLKKNLAKANYDQLYHLYLYIALDNGKLFTLEKNQVVKLTNGNPYGNASDINKMLLVPVPHPIRFYDFIKKPMDAIGHDLWVYDPAKNNCQKFVYDILNANGLMNAGLKGFILQDPEKIFESSGLLKKISQATTDLAARGDLLLKGKGRANKSAKRSEAKRTNPLLTLLTLLHDR